MVCRYAQVVKWVNDCQRVYQDRSGETPTRFLAGNWQANFRVRRHPGTNHFLIKEAWLNQSNACGPHFWWRTFRDGRMTSTLRSVTRQFAHQPRLGEFPIAHDTLGRNLQYFRSLLYAQATEEPQFDDARFTQVDLGEAV